MVIKQIVFSMLMAMVILTKSQLAVAQANAPVKNDENFIRDLIQQQNNGKDVIKFTEEAIFVSGAYPRPMIGRQEREANKQRRDEINKSRPNQETKYDVVRLVVSQSGDMAYEYGNHTISYDGPDKKRTGFSGSYLRVWRKMNDNWLVDASFARPNQP